MGRAPCCQKVGLKKGPWTTEEDRILIAHIQNHGHPNWRSLPKQAGLLRCGKSCRLRWINYLRPDIKRGNFSKAEEEAIIDLHDKLGNKWSQIAASLPGRTDNEIKNVWHTHLKKRAAEKMNNKNNSNNNNSDNYEKQNSSVTTTSSEDFAESAVSSSQPSWSGLSSSPSVSTGETDARREDLQCRNMDVTTTTTMMKEDDQIVDSLPFDDDNFPEIDDSFWADALSENNSDMSFLTSDFWVNELVPNQDDDGMDFWYNILLTTGGDVQ